jgi:hypothetical protein
MFVLGFGLGMVMQVLVLAVQNAVEYSDLGVATSGATLFRSIGGSVGTAILGSIFAAGLKSHLQTNLRTHPAAVAGLPHSQIAKLSSAVGNPDSLKALPSGLHDIYITSFTSAIDKVFVVGAAVSAVAFILSLFLEPRPLRGTAEASGGIGETFAVPKQGDSLAEISRALGVLVGREGRRHLVEGIALRAGVDLSAAASWLLAVNSRHPGTSVQELSERWDVPLERARAGLEELVDHGMVEVGSDGEVTALTAVGRESAEKLVAERRATLSRLLDGWDPERHDELAGLLTRLADEVGVAPGRDLVAR